MSSILVINAAGRETRVALVENGHIAEFYLERKKDLGIVGNIYKGRVVRVLPGMQAAFVDIGLEKAAFLYVNDVVYDPDFAKAQFELTEGEHDEDIPDVPDVEVHSDEHPEEIDVQELSAGELASAELADADADAEADAETHSEPAPASPASASAQADDSLVAGVTSAAAALLVPQVPAEPEAAQQGAPEPAPEPTESSTPVQAAPEQAAATEVIKDPAASPQAPTASQAGPEDGEAALLEQPAPGAEAATAFPASTEQAIEATLPPATVETTSTPTAPAREDRGERRAPRDQRGRDKQRRRDRGAEDKEKKGEARGVVRKAARIEDLLKVGQEVVVQASKDPIGTKGARLTSHISIPGRHLVFMPTVDHIGISRRIGNEKERRRLREIVERLRPPGTGFIVRTVAENVPQEKLESDIRFLIEVWNEVVRRNEKRRGPGLLHPDLDLILRATRDLFAHDVEKLVVDEREEYERILQFVTAQDASLRDRVVLHEAEEPVFDAYGIEQELKRATQRKVWLKSGGYLIMDQAEALTAIDVNSGRYVGKKSLEETITKINVEAAKEIVYQLRLRNIGGIIICDFIDMEKPQNRDKVFKTLQEALGRDKAKTNVLRISELGLIEMTRKRVRESIGRILHEDCTYCDGKGYVKTTTTICYEIFREIRREAAGYKDGVVVINCSPDVARLLQGEERGELRHLMDRFNKSIQVKAQQNYHREQFDIYGRPAQKEDSPPGGGTSRGGGRQGGSRGQGQGKGQGQGQGQAQGQDAPLAASGAPNGGRSSQGSGGGRSS
jgi:Rne/Rng family ribonuclease